MRVRTTITGTSPLVMKNPQGADPDNEIVREIQKITDKGSKMSDEDQANKARLQFACSLYIDDAGPYVPAANIRRCLIEAARVRRLGKVIERAVIPYALKFPLIYEGPRDIEGLWSKPIYRYRTMVNGNPSQGKKKSMIPSTRPYFPSWSFVAEWEVLTEIFKQGLSDFIWTVEKAGVMEGLGDNRINGFGRFTATIEQFPA